MDQNLTYSNLIFLLFQQYTLLVSAENVFNENWFDILWFGSLGRRGNWQARYNYQYPTDKLLYLHWDIP